MKKGVITIDQLAELNSKLAEANAKLKEEKEKAERLAEENAKYHLFVKKAASPMYRTTLGGKFLEWNPAFTKTLGYSEEEFAGLVKNNVLIAEDFYKRPENRSAFRRIMDEKGMVEGFEVPLIKKNGKILDVKIYATKEGNEFWGSIIDITELKKLAITDDLTGLYTRRILEPEFENFKQAARAYNTPLSLCLIDLKNLHEFNASYGHEQGDQLFLAVAAGLRFIARPQDAYGKITNGDEFWLIMPNTRLTESHNITKELKSYIERQKLPLADGFKPNPVITCTYKPDEVRVTVALASFKETSTLEFLIRDVDRALYKEKKENTGEVSVYEPEACNQE